MLDFESKEKIRPDYQSQGDDRQDAIEAELAKLREQGLPEIIQRPFYADFYEFLTGGVKREVSPVDRNDYNYYPVSEPNQRMRRGLSVFIQFLLQVLIVFSTTMVYKVQAWLEANKSLTVYGVPLSLYSQYIATALNVLQSWFFAFINGYIGDALNDFENHRTQDDFDNADINKQAIFTFVNSYVSFFYLAFVAGNQIMVLFGFPVTNGCAGYATCIDALSFNLNSILIANLVAQNTALFLPCFDYIQKVVGDWWLGPDANPAVAMAEDDPLKPFADQYFNYESKGNDPSDAGDLADAYCGFYKQFGYLMLFLPAYPAAAFICFIANWIEMNGDMRSFSGTLRSFPVGAQDIGAWGSCFSTLVALAIPVNCALVIFTMNALDPLLDLAIQALNMDASLLNMLKLLSFVILQYIVFLIVAAINTLVPNQDPIIAVNAARKQVVISNLTLIDLVSDQQAKLEAQNANAENMKAQFDALKNQNQDLVAKVNQLKAALNDKK
jgi:hypothetical protein